MPRAGRSTARAQHPAQHLASTIRYRTAALTRAARAQHAALPLPLQPSTRATGSTTQRHARTRVARVQHAVLGVEVDAGAQVAGGAKVNELDLAGVGRWAGMAMGGWVGGWMRGGWRAAHAGVRAAARARSACWLAVRGNFAPLARFGRLVMSHSLASRALPAAAPRLDSQAAPPGRAQLCPSTVRWGRARAPQPATRARPHQHPPAPHLAVHGDQDVLGLDVAVHDAQRVQAVQG